MSAGNLELTKLLYICCLRLW